MSGTLLQLMLCQEIPNCRLVACHILTEPCIFLCIAEGSFGRKTPRLRKVGSSSILDFDLNCLFVPFAQPSAGEYF